MKFNYFAAAVLSAVLLIGCSEKPAEEPAKEVAKTQPAAEQATKKEAEAKPQEQKPVRKQISMQMTLGQYLDRYNKFAQVVNSSGSGLKIPLVDPKSFVNKKEVSQNVCPTRNACMVFGLEPATDDIYEVTLIAGGDGTQKAAVMALSHFILGSAAAVSDIDDHTKIASFIAKVVGQDGNTQSFHGYEFSFRQSQKLGNWLFIKKEK